MRLINKQTSSSSSWSCFYMTWFIFYIFTHFFTQRVSFYRSWDGCDTYFLHFYTTVSFYRSWDICDTYFFHFYKHFYTTDIILQEPGWMRHILCSEFCMSSTLSDLGRSPTKEKGRLYLTLYMRYHISHMKWYFKKII